MIWDSIDGLHGGLRACCEVWGIAGKVSQDRLSGLIGPSTLLLAIKSLGVSG
jgi:hypothetical protein